MLSGSRRRQTDRNTIPVAIPKAELQAGPYKSLIGRLARLLLPFLRLVRRTRRRPSKQREPVSVQTSVPSRDLTDRTGTGHRGIQQNVGPTASTTMSGCGRRRNGQVSVIRSSPSLDMRYTRKN
ncbi:hypothetical protein N7465_003135 [Penicillium sp. CMV-2018d]|nr:hypothetical protein N7465_003135 [Penicillium sp. CMV-2018d]